jgi:phospholipid/cholesterol/gamma-HCH transport system substrate-binding protein
METKANHLMIGGFVLTVLCAAFGFVYWIEAYMNGGSSQRYDVVFTGSVQGLGEASAVLFNGLRVGTVKKLRIVPEDTRKVRAVIAVAKDTPVARISAQGLAGMAALEISPGTPDAPLLNARADQLRPEIHADTIASTGNTGGMPEAMGNANALFIRLNEMVATNSDLVHQTAKNIEAFTGMLSANKEEVAGLVKEARILAARFNGLADKMDTAMVRFTSSISGSNESAVSQAQQAAQSFRKLADKLEKSFGDQADTLTRQAQRSMREFELFMKDGRRVAENLDRVLQKVEANPSSLIFGGGGVPEYKPGQQ